MRKISLFALICAAVLFSGNRANAEVAGGFIFGAPSAFSLRIDDVVVLGLGGYHYGGLIVWADHWIIHRAIPGTSSVTLNWYLGIGGEVGVGYDGYWDHHYYYRDYHGSAFLGVRIPVGLEIPFEQRWEAFFEVVPVMSVFPFGPTGNGGIGIRYQF